MQDWQRLADHLVARRAELGHRRRSTFLRWRGAADFERIAGDLEGAVRANYDSGSLATAEHVYLWQPGSVRAVLGGGAPIPIEPVTGEDYVAEPGPKSEDSTVEHLLLEKMDEMQRDIRRMDERLAGVERRLDGDS